MSACSCFLCCILDVVVLHVVVEQLHLVWVCRFLSLSIEFWLFDSINFYPNQLGLCFIFSFKSYF